MQSVKIGNDDLSVTLIPFGARLVDIRMASCTTPLILGYPQLSDYLSDTAYMGAMIGRVANRIASGRAMLNDMPLSFDKNENSIQTLHGGSNSCSFAHWRIAHKDSKSVIFYLDEPDGHMGFPGNCRLQVHYEVIKPMGLHVTLQAISDRDGFCNLTLHPYFCLDDSGNIANHDLQIHAEHYLPVDDFLIPTGKINKVIDSQFDFLKPRNLEPIVSHQEHPIDHNYCLATSQTELREIAVLKSRLSNITLKVFSTEAGLQFYTGHHLKDIMKGHHEQPYTPFSGMCLEPQAWPDAPNQETFPSIFLKANTPYKQMNCFYFES